MSLPQPRSGLTQRSRAALGRATERLAQATAGGPAVVIGLGIGHLLVALWNFRREAQEVGTGIGPFGAAGLVGIGGALVCAVGYWLWHSEYAARERWLVAAGCLVGAVVIGTVMVASVMIRLLEGRMVSEPVFVLSLASGQGAFSGSLVAVLYARARREAVAARERRDQIEFVAGILRHDVLNSMTVIRSRADLIEEGETDRTEEFAEIIVNRSDKVIDLSERVKEIVDIMASDESLQLTPTALAPIVDEQVAALEPASGVTIERDVDDVEVLADDLLAEVVGNLLGNALDHGVDSTGTIGVTTDLDEDWVRLRVADTGPGVPPERRERIFERGASSGGGGFGLFFVASMVDYYGGDIWVEDRADGRSGAVFVVELERA